MRAGSRPRASLLAEDAAEGALEYLAIAGASLDLVAGLVDTGDDLGPYASDAVLVRVHVDGHALRLVRCGCGDSEVFDLLGDNRAPMRLVDFEAARQALGDAVLAAVVTARARRASGLADEVAR